MKIVKIIIALIASTLFSVGALAEEYNQNLVKGLQAAQERNNVEAIKFFKAGALEGDKYCCGRLAGMYLNGLGTDVNYEEARKWAMKGYNLGNSYSAAMVAYTYMVEYGQDNLDAMETALPYLEFAYNAEDREFDNPDLYANIGLTIASFKAQIDDLEEGLEWLDKTVQDFPTYAPVLGQAACIYWGNEDYAKAAKIATMADKEGNIQGSFVLGWCMAHGEGVIRNEEAGFKKIRKAAYVGTPGYAMYALGECYYNGIGTPVNKTLAKEWFTKAANAGIEEAQEKLEILF